MADSSHCFYCREDLGGKRFVRNEGKPVCVRCHTKFCANSCAECHRPIPVESKELSHKGRYWHEECFRCAKCYKPLAKEPFSTKDDRIMCGKCCSREDAPRCHGCYKPILAGTESVEYKGNSWHDECFTCFGCKRPIGSQSFLSKGTDIYCNPCYDKKFAKHCVSCKKPITSGGVNYQDQPWHGHCFVCSSCSKPLAGTSFTNHQDQVFCVDCYKSSVAKKCSGCQNPITGCFKSQPKIMPISSSFCKLAPNGTLTLGATHRLVNGSLHVIPFTGQLSLFRLWGRERSRQEVTSLKCTEGDLVKWEGDNWDTQRCAPLVDSSLQCGEPMENVVHVNWNRFPPIVSTG